MRPSTFPHAVRKASAVPAAVSLLLQRLPRCLEKEQCPKRPVMSARSRRWRALVCRRRYSDLGFSLTLATSIHKAFSVYTICPSIPLLSKIHSLMSCNFSFVFILFQGSSHSRKKERKKEKPFHLQTRSSVFTETDLVFRPTCRPNGRPSW